jgi:hypothetical protein
MGTPGSEQRRAPRIEHHFMLRVRQVDSSGQPGEWDISTVRNISETGILFHSSRDYALGSKLEIKMTLPITQENCTLWGTVVRSLIAKDAKNVYRVAINISDIEENAKEAFCESIKFFEKKEKEKK